MVDRYMIACEKKAKHQARAFIPKGRLIVTQDGEDIFAFFSPLTANGVRLLEAVAL